MSIYQLERGGRTLYVRAQWDAQRAQFTSTDVPLSVARAVTGYQYTFARSLEGLVAMGVRCYPSLAAARRRSL